MKKEINQQSNTSDPLLQLYADGSTYFLSEINEPIMNTADAAEFLGISVNKFSNMKLDGHFIPYARGRRGNKQNWYLTQDILDFAKEYCAETIIDSIKQNTLAFPPPDGVPPVEKPRTTPAPEKDEPVLMRTKQAAEYLNVHIDEINKLRQRGFLTPAPFCGRAKFYKTDLDKVKSFLDEIEAHKNRETEIKKKSEQTWEHIAHNRVAENFANGNAELLLNVKIYYGKNEENYFAEVTHNILPTEFISHFFNIALKELGEFKPLKEYLAEKSKSA